MMPQHHIRETYSHLIYSSQKIPLLLLGTPQIPLHTYLGCISAQVAALHENDLLLQRFFFSRFEMST
jgi:hypothetical protein